MTIASNNKKRNRGLYLVWLLFLPFHFSPLCHGYFISPRWPWATDWKLEMGPSLQILIGPRDLKHPEKKPLLNPGTKSGIREAAALSEGRGQTRQPGAGGSRTHKDHSPWIPCPAPLGIKAGVTGASPAGQRFTSQERGRGCPSILPGEVRTSGGGRSGDPLGQALLWLCSSPSLPICAHQVEAPDTQHKGKDAVAFF